MAHVVSYTFNISGNAASAINNITQSSKAATNGIDKMANTAKKIANIGFAFQHVFSVFNRISSAVSGCVRAYEAQSTAEKKLETLMRNSIGATDAEIQSIKDLTSAQQKLGVIGDEVQVAGAQELSTYVSKTRSLKQLIPAMNDMLAQQYGLNASQEQAVTIAQMMGKVLDGQVGALSRYGYRFDEAQEKVLKFGKEEERVSMLSEILTKYVGGVNRALADTPEGKMKQTANNMGDVKERIGAVVTKFRGGLAPALQTIIDKVNGLIDFIEEKNILQKISTGIGFLINVLVKLTSFIAEHWKWIVAITAAYASYQISLTLIAIGEKRAAIARLFSIRTTQFSVAWTKLSTACINGHARAVGRDAGAMGVGSVASGLYAAGMGIVAAATRVATGAVKMLSRAIYAIPIIGWIALAITLIVKLVKILWDKSRTFRKILFGTWGAIKAVFHNVAVVVKNVWGIYKEYVIDKPIGAIVALKNYILSAWDAIKNLWQSISDGFTSVWASISGFFSGIWNRVAGAFSGVSGFMKKWIVDPLKKAFSGVWDFIKGIFDKIMQKLSIVFRPIIKLWKRVFSGDFQDVTDAAVQGAMEGGEHFDKEKGEKEGESDFSLPGMSDVPGFDPISDKPKPEKPDKSNSSGSGGGSGSGRNISITINKLVEHITLSVTNLQEGTAQIKNAVAEALVTAVNDVNLMQ
jgi:hypothetical protein